MQRPPIAPARCISLKGNKVEIGRASPLRETTSAAYGVGHHSIARAAAVGCPVSPFFASSVQGKGEFCPVKRGRTRHTPIWRLVRRCISHRRWLGRAPAAESRSGAATRRGQCLSIGPWAGMSFTTVGPAATRLHLNERNGGNHVRGTDALNAAIGITGFGPCR